MNDIEVQRGYDASFLCISWEHRTDDTKPLGALHFGVNRGLWVWGRRHTMEGADMVEYGLGPLFLLCICYGKT
jgi:hypothetical protein